MDALTQSLNTLNAVFKDSGTHFEAHAAAYLNAPAIRIIYRGCPLADPRADLQGDDARKLASAFNKAGMKFQTGANTPYLAMEANTPPVHWMTNYINPWQMHVVKPDLAYIQSQAEALKDALKLRFAPLHA